MSEDVINAVIEFVESESKKPDAYYKEAYELHIKPVVSHALNLADRQDADKEIVEIAAWLHDIGSIMGRREDHHIAGAEVTDDLLTGLGYPEEKIEKVKHCILTHRGSVNIRRESVEAQILADADAMSHFDDIEGILVRVFDGDKGLMLAKLERSYAKLSEDAKGFVSDRLENARRDLG